MAKADIEAVKAAHPILDVLRDLGIPVQHGRIRCLRPENHANGDRTPSVSIWTDRDQFKCWVCPDVKGDVIDLVKLARGCSFKDALAFLGAAPSPSSPSSRPSPVQPTPGTGQSPVQVPSALPSSGLPASIPPLSRSPSEVLSPSALPTETEEAEAEALRQRILAALLEACAPVGGAAGRYLAKRRIFKRTWDAQRLRMIDDYAAISRKLEAAFGLDDLVRMGFFNAAGHLRFYRHVLLFPYYDITGRAVYMQARAIETDAAGSKGPGPKGSGVKGQGAMGAGTRSPMPKELSLAGHIPLPYNSRLLDGEPGQIYLCEGVIDTLTLLEQGFPSVGVPGAANFKAAWAPLFRNKSVHVAFDPDGPGDTGAAKAIERLTAMGIEARRLAPPTGKDLNEWFRKG
ncbi:MAG: toprim domain-containing protein [Fibrobacteres bacterium]|nr:toprim domain-containing protein [Fibrobacterota bacterium]